MLNFLFGNKKEKITETEKNTRYLSLLVANIIRENADAIVIQLRQPEKKIAYQAGQFLTLIVTINGENLRRSYSVCSSPFTDETIDVMVKRIPNGKVSNFLNNTLTAGQNLEIMEPMGNFTAIPDAKHQRHIVLLAAGSGITPLMSIAKTILNQEPNSQVSLLYGNRNENSIIFKQSIADLQQQHLGRFEVEHILSQPDTTWRGHSGRLNRHQTIEILEKISPDVDTEYFMCGPVGMMDEMSEALKIMGIAQEKIHKESFVTAETASAHGMVIEDPKKVALETRQVTVIYEGTEYKIEVSPKKTILEAALLLNIDLPYSCQSGLCTACRGKCLSGKVKLDEEDGLSPAEKQQGYVLTCVGHPLTDDVVIEIG
ncbi:MAG: ferredoxin--NADP reductase [Verrucomicrobia bacterium]|nr:ferredoxin--NADP reductase [Cytophagales bacterium]